MPGRQHWTFHDIQRNITNFVKTFRSNGYDVKAFIDAGISTDETANKFKRRREKAIEKCERRVPYNFHTFIGEAF